MNYTAEHIQKIIDEGFNNRERWSEVPAHIQEKVKAMMKEKLPESFCKQAEDKNDVDRYYFVLGILHAFPCLYDKS